MTQDIQSINELKSYTEYNVNTPTSVFTIGFQYEYNVDGINVYVDDVEATEVGYAVQHDSHGTITLTPAVPTGVVRVSRETDIDTSAHTFSAGAKFTAGNMDENFEQIRHAQQEVRDAFDYLEYNTLGVVVAAKDATTRANNVADEVEGLLDKELDHNDLHGRDASGAHPSSAVLDASGLTQQEINVGVESIAALRLIADPVEGSRVYVKSYHHGLGLGGGMRVYVAERAVEDDGFLCIKGWVLQVDDAPNAYQAGAVGDGVYDDTDALQRLFNYSAPTTWQGGTTQSQSYFRNGLKVRVHKGCYRTTRSLLVGTGADIEFENAGSFFFSKDDGAVVYADFSNPLDFVIKSANYDVNGGLCAYDKFVSGSELDAYTYSNTHNIKIKNLQIIAKNQIYGGLKLTASPQSIIENFYISNVDYGVALSSSWASSLTGQTTHHKAGICAVATNHNLKFNGYFNRFNSTTLPLNTGVNLIPTALLGANNSCGVFLQGAQSAVSTQLTCEKNAIGLITYYCPTTLGSFYSELNSEYTLYANASNVSVDTVSGYFDNRNFKIQNNASVTVVNYDAGSLTNFVPDIVEYADEKNRLSVFNGFHYFARNVIYQNYDKIIYVDPTLGNDLYTGFNKNYPCKSLNRAIEIASSVTSDSTMLYNKCTVVVNGGSHIINNVSITNAELIVTSGTTVASINFNTDSSFRLSNSTLEIINCVVNVDKSYGWASYGTSGLNVLILRDCVVNLSNNACILYSNTNATTHLYLTSGAVNGGASESIAIIPNGSFATIEVKCSAEVSSAITSRADKGLNLNRDNAIKIFPISLR